MYCDFLKGIIVTGNLGGVWSKCEFRIFKREKLYGRLKGMYWCFGKRIVIQNRGKLKSVFVLGFVEQMYYLLISQKNGIQGLVGRNKVRVEFVICQYEQGRWFVCDFWFFIMRLVVIIMIFIVLVGIIFLIVCYDFFVCQFIFVLFLIRGV